MLKRILFYLFLILSLPLFESCLFLFAHDCEEKQYLEYDLRAPEWMKEVVVSDEIELNQYMAEIFSIPELEERKYEEGMKCKIELDSTFLSLEFNFMDKNKKYYPESFSCRWIKDEKKRVIIEEVDGIFTFDCNKDAKKQKPAKESKEASYWAHNTKNVKFVKLDDGYNLFLTTQDDVVLGPFHFTKPI